MTPALLFLTLAAIVGAGPLATVNKTPITGADLLAQLQQLREGDAKRAGGEADIRKALDAAIDRRLVLLEARRKGLAQDPTIVRAVKSLEHRAATDLLHKLEVADKSGLTEAEVSQLGDPGAIQALENGKLEARRSAFQQELWARHRVKEPKIEWNLAALKAAAASKDTAEVGSWAGGKLTMAAFVANLNLELLAKLPFDHQQEQIESLRRELIRIQVVSLEVAARNLARSPEIVAAVETRRDELMESKLFDEHVFKGVAMGPEEEKRYYDTHLADFTVAARRHLLQIVVPTQEKARATLKKLAAGANFAALARTLSTDPESAKRDGDLGWVTDAAIGPEFLAVLELKQEEISAPIKTVRGFHLIKVIEVAPAGLLPFNQVKDDARKVALRKKIDDKRLAWLRKLRAAAVIVVDEAELKAFATENAR